MKRKIIIFVLVIVLSMSICPSSIFVSNAEELAVLEIDEEASHDLLFYGDAKRLDEAEIELTPLETWHSGSVWYNNKIITGDGFKTEFYYWAGGGREAYLGGADGIVLTFAEKTGLGGQGGDMGYVSSGSYGVELDSYDRNTGDPKGKHIGIIKDNVSNHICYTNDDRVDDSQWHKLTVNYEGNTLTVYLDDSVILSADDVKLSKKVYLGISAATGDGINRHLIKDFYFKGTVSQNEQIDARLTSTKSRYRNNYNSLINSTDIGELFSEYARGLNPNDNAAVIPGLETTNMGGFGRKNVSTSMVPQGICIAGKYILISAYDHNEKNQDPSVIYVLNQKNRKYLTTLVLTNSDNSANNDLIGSHVGAMAYDGDGTVYIADSKNTSDSKKYSGCIWKLKTSEIATAVKTGKDAFVTRVSDRFDVEINPSFLNYYGGNLFIGNHNKILDSTDEMMIYGIDGEKKTDYTIQIPGQCQGIGITEIGEYTYLFCSCSRGANDIIKNVIPNYSRFFVYRFQRQENGDFTYLLTNDAYYGSPTGGNQVKLFQGAPMSEDIEIQGDTIFTCHESAANAYNTRCCYPLDIVIEGSAAKYVTLPSSLNSSSFPAIRSQEENNNSEGISVIDEGYCGEDAYYVLYSNGVMNINKGGAIYDYDSGEAPWESHLEEIRELYIGADINVIGSGAFRGAVNLDKVEVSGFSNEEETLEIKDQTFEDCNNLEKLVLPGKEYHISDDAFSSKPVVYSEDPDVLNYAQENQFKVHEHKFEFRSKVEPTCGTQGYSVYACSCGEEEYREVTDHNNSNHSFKEIDHVDATEDKGGYTEYICTVCGADKLDTTEPKGHPEEASTAIPTTSKTNQMVSKITLSGISKQIAAGKSIQLTATVLPKDATNKNIKWSSSNKKVATVTQTGKVQIKKGTGGKEVTITAKAADGSGKKAEFKIKIMKGAVKSIKIKGAKKTLKVNKTMKLKAVVKVTKGKPVNKKIQWVSSNKKYATVSKAGKVKAQKAGKGKKVTITAKATDGTGKKKSVTIKIK